MKRTISAAAVAVMAVSSVAVQAAGHHPGHHAGHKAPHHTKSKAQVIYTCVMHPEVRMHKPGKCPKCGMTLVRKK